MANHQGQADKVLRKNRRIFTDLILTESLKAELMAKYIFSTTCIEELFMVCTTVMDNK